MRLIAPGWYGVANVKWLTRIEVRSQRYAGRFMARDYVTIREEQREGETVWTFATVGHDRLKSAPAKVTRRGDQYAIMGAAWGAPIERVEVRIDDGPWMQARLKRHQPQKRRSAGSPGRSGRGLGHAAIGPPHRDLPGVRRRRPTVQPAPDDPFLASKRTYWESNGQITRRVTIP